MNKRISITIEGKTPLLMNRFTDANQLESTEGTRASIKTSDGDDVTERQVFHPGILSAKHEKFAGTHYPSFPPKLIKGILSHEPGSVIDPFCGAGTTCVVAESMRRRWIGIDVDEEALKRCVRRLKKA